MPEWLSNIAQEWTVIQSAPLSFVTVSAIAAVVIWFIVNGIYSIRLANKDGEISLLMRQRDDYKDKLGGASPDQAKAKIDALEKRIALTIGSHWMPLTGDEGARLTAALGVLEKRRIQVMYVNQLGKELAQSIADAFTRAGWKDMHFSEGGGLGIGISTGRGNGMAFKLKDAIEASTRFKKVESYGPDEADPRSSVFVGVGINPD
jgi:hypothetical protein